MRSELYVNGFNSSGGVYCDWRVSVSDCVEGEWFQTVHLINAALCLVGAIEITLLLYDRIVLQKMSVWKEGFLGGFEGGAIFFLASFSLLSMHSFLVAFEVYGAYVYREVVFFLAYTLLLCACSVFSLASFRAMTSQGPSMNSAGLFTLSSIDVPRWVHHLLLGLFVVLPILFNIAFAAVLGASHDAGEDMLEQTLYRVFYTIFASETLLLLLFMTMTGIGLAKLMKDRIMKRVTIDSTVVKIAVVKRVAQQLPLTAMFQISFTFVMALYPDNYAIVPFSKAESVLVLLVSNLSPLLVCTGYMIGRCMVQGRSSGKASLDEAERASPQKPRESIDRIKLESVASDPTSSIAELTPNHPDHLTEFLHTVRAHASTTARQPHIDAAFYSNN